MEAMGGISRGDGLGRENLGSSSQALESSLDVSLTQQKVPGDGPHPRKDLGHGSWREGPSQEACSARSLMVGLGPAVTEEQTAFSSAHGRTC